MHCMVFWRVGPRGAGGNDAPAGTGRELTKGGGGGNRIPESTVPFRMHVPYQPCLPCFWVVFPVSRSRPGGAQVLAAAAAGDLQRCKLTFLSTVFRCIFSTVFGVLECTGNCLLQVAK